MKIHQEKETGGTGIGKVPVRLNTKFQYTTVVYVYSITGSLVKRGT